MRGQEIVFSFGELLVIAKRLLDLFDCVSERDLYDLAQHQTLPTARILQSLNGIGHKIEGNGHLRQLLLRTALSWSAADAPAESEERSGAQSLPGSVGTSSVSNTSSTF